LGNTFHHCNKKLGFGNNSVIRVKKIPLASWQLQEGDQYSSGPSSHLRCISDTLASPARPSALGRIKIKPTASCGKLDPSGIGLP
jgi:hypothetical protein